MSRLYVISMREKHIRRKKRICQEVYGFDWYKQDGYYDKGKIHCSCSLCAAKTNDRLLSTAGTHKRYGKKNWKYSDRKKIDSMNDKLKLYRMEEAS